MNFLVPQLNSKIPWRRLLTLVKYYVTTVMFIQLPVPPAIVLTSLTYNVPKLNKRLKTSRQAMSNRSETHPEMDTLHVVGILEDK